jgi:hypothetical protein
VNEVEIIITGKNTAGPAFKEAQRDADKLGRNLNSTERDAAKLGRELKTVDRDSHEAGRAMDSASRDVNQLGNNFEEAARDAGHLERKILEVKAAMTAFAVEFDKTGSSDALAGFRKAKSELSQLQQVAKALATDAGGISKALKNVLSGDGNLFQKAGGILGALFNPKTIQTGISGLGNLVAESVQKWPLAAAIVGGIIIGAPAIAGAVTAVMGTAAVGAGLLIAFRKPGVKAAFTELGHSMMTQLTTDAQDFEAPLIRAAGRIGRAFSQLDLGTMFHDAAKFVEPLANGLIGLVQGIMPGFNDLIHNGGPAIAELSRTLSVLGTDVGGLFRDLASSAKGGAAGLHDLTDVFSLLIKLTGISIGTISMLAGWLDAIDSKIGLFTGTLKAENDLLDLLNGLMGGNADNAGKMASKTIDVNTALGIYHGKVKLAADGTAVAVNAFDVLAQQLNQVTANADTLAGAMVDKVLGSTLSMDHAVLSFNESLTALDDNFKRGHITLDITKAKGQQFREAVLASVQANLQEYDTLIKLGMGADQAAAAYDANTGALERQLQKLGLTKGQIDDLIGKYRGVPANVDTDIATKGLTKAIEDLTSLIRLINGIPDHTVHIDTIYTSYNRPGTRAGSQGSAFAHGGIVGAAGGGARGGLTLVGEQGPELVRLPFGSTVHSNPDSEQMATAMASGTSGGTGRIWLDTAGAEDDIKRLIRKWVRIDGGGSVQTAFGRT